MWPEQAGWSVSLPQYFSQDPYHSFRDPGLGDMSVWVPLVGWGQEGMVWWGLEERGAQISQRAAQLPSPVQVRDSWKEDTLGTSFSMVPTPCC